MPVTKSKPRSCAILKRGLPQAVLKNYISLTRPILYFNLIVLLLAAHGPVAFAQTTVSAAPPGKTIFRDSDGNLVNNDEFVDIRTANFHIKDQTLVRTLDDGMVEFRLQKIPQEGAAAPDFSAKLIDGTLLNHSDLKGKVVVLNFWFIACAACREETPRLNAFSAKFRNDPNIEFVAMTADPRSSVKKYLTSHHFAYKMTADAGAALKMFVVGGYPKNIVIGKDGKIAYWRSTIVAWDKFESVVRAELAK